MGSIVLLQQSIYSAASSNKNLAKSLTRGANQQAAAEIAANKELVQRQRQLFEAGQASVSHNSNENSNNANNSSNSSNHGSLGDQRSFTTVSDNNMFNDRSRRDRYRMNYRDYGRVGRSTSRSRSRDYNRDYRGGINNNQPIIERDSRRDRSYGYDRYAPSDRFDRNNVSNREYEDMFDREYNMRNMRNYGSGNSRNYGDRYDTQDRYNFDRREVDEMRRYRDDTNARGSDMGRRHGGNGHTWPHF